MPIVEVIWVDSSGTAGWYSEEDYAKFADDSDSEDGFCKTAGYLYRESDKTLAIILNQSQSNNMDMMIQIPKVAIISRTVLREA